MASEQIDRLLAQYQTGALTACEIRTRLVMVVSAESLPHFLKVVPGEMLDAIRNEVSKPGEGLLIQSVCDNQPSEIDHAAIALSAYRRGADILRKHFAGE